MCGGAKANVVQSGGLVRWLAPLLLLQKRWPKCFAEIVPVASVCLSNFIIVLSSFRVASNKGVYASVMGPNLETRAEYRFLRTIGADAVGMSTVPEVLVANHMRLPCCAVSVLTDDCDPDNLQPANIAEILKMAGKAEARLTELYVGLIDEL